MKCPHCTWETPPGKKCAVCGKKLAKRPKGPRLPQNFKFFDTDDESEPLALYAPEGDEKPPLFTVRMMIGTISVILFLVISMQSCMAGLKTALDTNGSTVDTQGFIFAFCLLLGSITGISTRESKERLGPLLAFAFYSMGTVTAFGSSLTYGSLFVWGFFSLAFALVFLAAAILTKGTPSKKNTQKTAIASAAASVLILLSAVYTFSREPAVIPEKNNETASEPKSKSDKPKESPAEVKEEKKKISAKGIVKDGVYTAGTYKVGEDLPPGEYLIEAEESEMPAYVEIAEDDSGESDAIIMNDNFYNRFYITVEEDQYLTFEEGGAVPVEEAETFEAEINTYPSGMYLVGEDIPAGTYTISVEEDAPMGYGYYAIAEDSTGNIHSINTNENIQEDTELIIEEGQYLVLNGACAIEEEE